MKKLFIMMLLAVSATASAANNTDNDTLTILKPKKVGDATVTVSCGDLSYDITVHVVE